MIDQAIKVGRKLAEHGLIDGSSGNLSYIEGGKIVITRTGCILDELSQNDFVEVEIGKRDRRASSDLIVHEKIYEITDHRAVLHCHGSYNVALSLLEKKLVPLDLEGTIFLKEIEFVEGRFGSEELAKKIARSIKEKGFAVVRAHGIYAAGKDFYEAFKLASFVEHSCKVYYLTKLYSLLDKR
ncbi:class II aldolase/adducin family protein [Geoglobus ahangari]